MIIQRLVVIFCFIVLMCVVYRAIPVLAQDDANNETNIQSEEKVQDARFRLRDDFDLSGDSSSLQERISERDFQWNTLTKSSPASGADPVIGISKYGAYYDFKDGNPYAIYKPKEQ